VRLFKFALGISVAAAVAGAAFAGKANDVRKDAFKLLNEGVAAYNRSDFGVAVAALQKAAGMSLNSFPAHYYLGLSLAGDRRYAEAVDAYKIALDLDPNHIQANVSIGDALLAEGDIDEAQPYYVKAGKLRPEYAPALDGLARVAEAEADQDKAIALYGRALASDKGFAAAYTHLGDLYLRAGKLDEAVKLLVEAVSVRPDFGPGLDRLAAAYGRLGFTNEAVATIRKAIELEPRDPSHRVTLGEVLLGMDATTGAEASFQAAIAMDPALPGARSGLAEIARRRGDYAAALGHIDTALADPRLDRRTREALTARRAALATERDRVAALEVSVAASAATSPDRAELAEVEASKGHYDRAVELLGSAPSDSGPSERLAFYSFRAGRFREAHLLYAELARKLHRADLEVNDGASLARLGDDTEAKAAFLRALAIDTEQPEAQRYLGNALLRLGDTTAATATYRAFLFAHPDGGAAEQVRRVVDELAPPSPAGSAAPAVPAVPPARTP
jgi:tetratricopeptide (TPR) repeat protein